MKKPKFPKRSDAEKLSYARKALTIIRLKKDVFDNTEDRMEELDLVIAMDEAAEAAIAVIDDEDVAAIHAGLVEDRDA